MLMKLERKLRETSGRISIEAKETNNYVIACGLLNPLVSNLPDTYTSGKMPVLDRIDKAHIG